MSLPNDLLDDTLWRAGEIERSRVVRDTLRSPLSKDLYGEGHLRAIAEF